MFLIPLNQVLQNKGLQKYEDEVSNANHKNFLKSYLSLHLWLMNDLVILILQGGRGHENLFIIIIRSIYFHICLTWRNFFLSFSCNMILSLFLLWQPFSLLFGLADLNCIIILMMMWRGGRGVIYFHAKYLSSYQKMSC